MEVYKDFDRGRTTGRNYNLMHRPLIKKEEKNILYPQIDLKPGWSNYLKDWLTM